MVSFEPNPGRHGRIALQRHAWGRTSKGPTGGGAAEVPEAGHKIEVVPDWVCEIFSPSSKSSDREEKMPLYARYGVSFAWLLDPKTRTFEAYELTDGSWGSLGVFRDDDQISVRPFEAVTIHLSDLWA